MESRLIGRVISRRFRMEDVIGRGGMAIVYRAFDLKTQQTVAIKVLREEYEEDPEYRERFRREAEVCRKLNHPNIVNMIDYGSVDGISYIAMEYVDGPTLKELIVEQGRIPQDEAVRYTLQILAALGHAHQRGIVHRDVKPQNVLVSKTGQLKIGDFGIAGMADTKTLTTDGNVMGSVHYFSPEQAKGMKATAASDLYSVGVILYEMLAGHVPFDGETAVSVAMMHLMEPPKPVEDEVSVCRAIALVVRKSLEKQAQNRYQNAESMVRDLRRALRHPDGAFMEPRHSADEERRSEEQRKRRNHRRRQGKRWIGRLVTVTVSFMVIALIAQAGMRFYRMTFVNSIVPDLSGLDVASAERVLKRAGLHMLQNTAYSDVPEGFVCAQSPKANTEIAKGTQVKVTVSGGNGLVAVGRLLGLSQAEAEKMLTAQGFKVGEVTVVPSEMMRGTVVAQEPASGENALVGTQVDLQLSGGRVVVPELEGQRREEAIERISAVGLVLGTIDYENVETARRDSLVLAQSIEKFEEVLPGSVVNMTVGVYDKCRYTANVSVTVSVPENGLNVRITLVGADGTESDMYAATHMEPGETQIDAILRSETSGVRTWRLYLDGNFRSEATAVLQ